MKSLVLLLVVLLAACSTATPQTTPEQTREVEEIIQEVEKSAWQEIPLRNVNNGKEFTLSDFEEPVLLESFAVWCPTCTKQQKILKEYKETRTNFVSVSLNTDPNEDESLVREHAQNNGFDWYYSVSPAELTKSLIDEFGFQVVNAPAVPMVLLCPNGKTELFAGGVKDNSELTTILASCEA